MRNCDFNTICCSQIGNIQTASTAHSSLVIQKPKERLGPLVWLLAEASWASDSTAPAQSLWNLTGEHATAEMGKRVVVPGLILTFLSIWLPSLGDTLCLYFSFLPDISPEPSPYCPGKSKPSPLQMDKESGDRI